MNYSIDPILVIVGVVLAEIGGIGMIKESQRFPNPSYIKKLGKLTCILGIFALIIALLGIWVGAWS
jgi:hypothetical protein